MDNKATSLFQSLNAHMCFDLAIELQEIYPQEIIKDVPTNLVVEGTP